MTLSECSTIDTDAAQLLFTESPNPRIRLEESITSWTKERTCLECESSSGVASLRGEYDSDTWSVGHLGNALSRKHKARSSSKRVERQRLINEALAQALTFSTRTKGLRVALLTDPPHESMDRDRQSRDLSCKMSL
eukprot:TRINITY_DN57927_c0_g1_i1.p1 TRINITY_DN57927_c0_g1~~TRINITY_DN57927_c0_g1_i1.p1  ORF type:complete len:136 (+),score=13.69 TRINITY_DN57927_c0_g1_i1:62-469(+)